LLVVKLNKGRADLHTEGVYNMPWESSSCHPEVFLPHCGLHPSIGTAPATLLGIPQVPQTFVLDFIRQIEMVPQIIPTEYMPERGENWHGALPQEGVGI
jgi:hypothetical protein